jgi:2-keto-4-pentenoate hydratase/2-oxohepta-3-ene-1,7-dioic acid hydratase in catechol pathway
VKFATIAIASRPYAAVVADGQAYPFPDGVTVPDLVRLGLAEAVRRGDAVVAGGSGAALANVTLLAPLQPASVRDFVAFEEHVKGVRRSIDGAAGVVKEWYEAPTFYFTNPHTIVGPDADVAAPGGSERLDFELEVAAVAAGDGTVFGYTIMNDWSARDLQAREMRVGLGPAKGKDFATTLGPWLVTADELDGYRDGDGFLDLWCTATVNDTRIGRDLLSNMGWTFETLIAYAGRDSRVVAGDVFGSGTCGNGGCLAELWGRGRNLPPLVPGDVVTLTVEGIGSVSNLVVAGRPAPDLPPVRRRDPAAARRATPDRR